MNSTIMLLRGEKISKSVISFTANHLNNFFDLIILNKSGIELSRSKPRVSIKKCVLSIKDNPNILNPLMLKNPYILLAYGAPEESLKNITKLLNIKTINELEVLEDEKIKNHFNRNQSSALKKIRESIVSFKTDFKTLNKRTYIKDIILYYFFSKREVPKKFLRYQITGFVNKYYPELEIYNKDDLDTIIKELICESYLQEDEEVIYFPSNIFYNSKFTLPESFEPKISLAKYMDQDFNDKDLLQYRLKGLTLEEIGEIYGISRERVRQRQVKALNHLNNVLELEKYKDIFETYFFEKSDFINLFHEPPEVYELLKIRLEIGQKDAGNFVLESHDIASKDKLKYLMNHKFYVNRFGDIKRITKSEFADEVLFFYRDTVFTPEFFFTAYQNEAKKYPHLGLEIPNVRAAEGVLSRSAYALSSTGKQSRYYDYNFSEEDWALLLESVDSLGEGCFSTLKIFNEQLDLMEQLDIRDEYELHNIYKEKISLLNDSITLTRSPGFVINNVVKKEFIANKILDFTGRNLEEFLDYLYNEYGLKKSTMGAYVSVNLKQYVNEGIIVSSLEEKINESMIENLKQCFTLSVYMKPKVQEILNHYSQSLTSSLLAQLGYRMTGNVIFLESFSSMTSAFSSIVFKTKKWHRTEDEVGQSKEMSSFLFRMESERKIVMLGENLYCSVSYLGERGISSEMLNDFVASVYMYLPKTKYFSLYSLKKMGFKHPLIEYGFESTMYERLLTTSKQFNPVNRKTPMLFAKGKLSPVTLEVFFSDELLMFEEGIDIYDYIDELFEEYHIIFDLDDIKSRLKRYGAFFSDSLEKLYFDKETYLNEVYV